MAASGIFRSNLDSTESTKSTMSSEVRPISRRSSSADTGPSMERSTRIRRTTWTTLSLGDRSSSLDMLGLVHDKCAGSRWAGTQALHDAGSTDLVIVEI